MSDKKTNRLLESSVKTTNSLLSSTPLIGLTTATIKSSILTSSLLANKSLIDERLKKAEEESQLPEPSKKPKLALENRLLKTSSFLSSGLSSHVGLSSSKPVVNTQSVLQKPIEKPSEVKTQQLFKPTTSLSTNTSSLITDKSSGFKYLSSENKLLGTQVQSKAVVLENRLIKGSEKTDSNSSLASIQKPVVNEPKLLTENEAKYLANTPTYDDLIQHINRQHESFDEETKKIDDNNTKFVDPFSISKQISSTNYELVKYKNVLINLVSSSLLRSPNFKNSKDTTRASILDIASRIAPFDGEFILKLALYTRRELNIRVTANFLLSLAAFYNDCRPFICRYFGSSVVLPSDWIDVAEQYQLFFDKRIRYGALPSALRRAMVEKFPSFDEYQLAKYNKEKSKSKKDSKLKDIKHVKAKLTKDPATATASSEKPEDEYEDKYMKMLKDGLKVNDVIKIEVFVKDNCKNVKVDLVTKKAQTQEPKRLVGRRGKPIPQQKTEPEPVPLRFCLDYENNRITKKSFLNKLWSKAEFTNNNSGTNLFSNAKNSTVTITIKVVANEFTIEIDGKVVTKYEHKKHNTQLGTINCVRVSGSDIKLNNLDIENTDKIAQEHDGEETEEENKNRTFTLKQLIRQLHISKPLQHVFGLLGKKYPETYEEYLASGLPGIFDNEKAGKRMRLPIPETWETQISMKGNKAAVWEQLIDNKKLPFMAMLRNLRNMIKVGIDDKHHQWVLKKLQDEGAVVNSKQFPINFFSAYDALDDLEKEFNAYLEWADKGGPAGETAPVRGKGGKNAKVHVKKNKYGDMNYDLEILKRYRKAIDNALKIATTYNISPIKGRTLVLVDIGTRMDYECNTARMGKSKRTVAEVAILLGLMFKYSCEQSRLLFYNDLQYGAYTEMELEQGTILDNMKSVIKLRENKYSSSKNKQSISDLFVEISSNGTHYDNLVVLSAGTMENSTAIQFFNHFLMKYRVCVNEKLLFVNVDLGARSTSVMLENSCFNHENDVTISGYSDAILRFVAEKGNQGQLTHIENIDKSFDLPEPKQANGKNTKDSADDSIEKPLPIVAQVPKWLTTKVFISSTFLDMHSERDVLSRVVFPLLRTKFNSRFINVYEVDLRWGITESDVLGHQALDICLNQVLDCEFFVGMLGDRYGHILSSYVVKKHDDLRWLEHYPPSASITELEMHCAAFEKHKKNPQTALEKTFFFFRNNSFISNVPEVARSYFQSESSEATGKIKALKSKILSKSFEIFDGYTCEWLGMDKDGRALVTNLDEFGQRVFDNLLNAIDAAYPYGETVNLDENSHVTGLHETYSKSCAETFVGRVKTLNLCEKLIKDQFSLYNHKANNPHILLIDGEAGSGKTSLIAKLSTKLRDLTAHTFIHMVGACVGSEYIIAFLKRFCIETNKNYGLGYSEDSLNDSNDIKFFKTVFEEILNKLSNMIQDKFIIVVDGVDLFLDFNGDVDQSLQWLPDKIPPQITFILSARSDSNIETVLNRRVQNSSKKEKQENHFAFNKVSVNELEILEKSELIRQKLSVYNKALDETGFNNQMKFVTGKIDANSPLYLSLVCEELRLHNNFDTLSIKLREIPHKINALIPYILTRLEADFGVNYVAAAFLFLCCSKEGLQEYELKNLLSFYLALENRNCLNGIDKLNSIIEISHHLDLSKINDNQVGNPEKKFVSFIQSIDQTFLRPHSSDKSSSLKLRSHQTIENAIRLKYTITPTQLDIVHRIMSLYFWTELDNKFEYSWLNRNPRAFSYLPYHLAKSNSYQDLVNILCDLKFLAAKCSIGLAGQLLEDFELHANSKTKNVLQSSNVKSIAPKSAAANKHLSSQKFSDYKTFISTNYHILVNCPSLIYQLAMNQPANSSPAIDIKSVISGHNVSFMFEHLNKDEDISSLVSSIAPVTIKDFNESVTAVAMSPNGAYVACGTGDCEIKLFNLKTATLIKKFHGHSGKINAICFVGSDIFCSASSDGLASLWSVTGFRIKILNGHHGHVVSSCCAEPNGKNLITVGWDCTAKIWHSTEGTQLGEIKSHGRPINCVAYHPDGSLIATGCWDSCVRVFNVFERQRKAVLRGHLSSVNAIAYSKNGTYIASASIDGDVFLWNALNGNQVGTLKGHNLPVNSLQYSNSSNVLVTASTDRRTKLWSAHMGKTLKVIEDNVPITSVCFNQKTGQSIAVGYHTGEIRIYDLYSSGMNKFKCHDSFIRRLKFTKNGKFLISTSEASKAVVTNVFNFQHLQHLELLEHSGSVNALDVNQYDVIITGAEDTIVRVYSNAIDNDTDCRPIRTLSDHTSPVTACSFSSNGLSFVTTSKDALMIIWNLQMTNIKITEQCRINAAHADWITDCQWSNSADFILTSSNDFTMKVWDVATGNEKTKMVGHSASINTCAFQYGCAVSTCCDGSVKIWSHKGYEITTLLGHTARVNSCDMFVKLKTNAGSAGADENMEVDEAIGDWGDLMEEEEKKLEEEKWKEQHSSKISKSTHAVDQLFVATVSDDHTIRIWKPMESNELISLEGHNNKIESVSIGDNNYLCTGSSDKSAKIWNLNSLFGTVASGKIISHETRNHRAQVTSIATNKDATVLISSSKDGMIFVWKCEYSKTGALTNIKYIDEFQVHDASCNRTCIINEKDGLIEFATCSDDKSIKIWLLKVGDMLSLELKKRISCPQRVLYISTVQKLDNLAAGEFLLSVEYAVFLAAQNIVLYEIKNNYTKNSKYGCQISKYSSFLQNMKLFTNKLYISYLSANIAKVDLNQMLNKKDNRYLESFSTKADELFTDDKPSDIWFTSLLDHNNVLIAGDSKGDLYSATIAPKSVMQLVKRIHNGYVSEMLHIKTIGGIRLVTASQDGTIKIWTENAEKQLGQYNFNSGISSLTNITGKENTKYINLSCADQMGTIYIIKWHDKS